MLRDKSVKRYARLVHQKLENIAERNWKWAKQMREFTTNSPATVLMQSQSKLWHTFMKGLMSWFQSSYAKNLKELKQFWTKNEVGKLRFEDFKNNCKTRVTKAKGGKPINFAP